MCITCLQSFSKRVLHIFIFCHANHWAGEDEEDGGYLELNGPSVNCSLPETIYNSSCSCQHQEILNIGIRVKRLTLPDLVNTSWEGGFCSGFSQLRRFILILMFKISWAVQWVETKEKNENNSYLSISICNGKTSTCLESGTTGIAITTYEYEYYEIKRKKEDLKNENSYLT